MEQPYDNWTKEGVVKLLKSTEAMAREQVSLIERLQKQNLMLQKMGMDYRKEREEEQLHLIALAGATVADKEKLLIGALMRVEDSLVGELSSVIERYFHEHKLPFTMIVGVLDAVKQVQIQALQKELDGGKDGEDGYGRV